MRFAKRVIVNKCLQALRRSKALLNTIIFGSRVPVFHKGQKGRLLMAGSAAEVMLEMPDETAMEWCGNIYEHDGGAMEHHDSAAADSAKGKHTFTAGHMPCYGIPDDIFERIRMEHLHDTTQEWSKKNALITDIFVNVSHEFRTPLSVIQMAVETLDEHVRRGELDADRLQDSINIIDMNTRRLTRMVGNMLDITQIKAGSKQPLFSPVNMAALLRKLVALVKPYALKRGLEITLTCRKNIRVLCTDAELAARIVVNLLSNALKYTPRGGWVRVTCRGTAGGCRISVEDNGEGIPDNMQRQIFDHFHKANNTLVRSSEGCGIGLSLAKSLTELLGGSIWVESTLGCGSAFFVDLPDRRDAGVQQNTGLLSARLQDLVITELSDISF